MKNHQQKSRAELNGTLEEIRVKQPVSVHYTGKTRTTGGRDGSSRSSDGRLDIKQSSPGTSGIGTNPEQLLAAGWSACFISAMQIAAGQLKVRFPQDAAIDAEVDLCSGEEGYFLRARLNISLPGLDRDLAQKLVDYGEQHCPYSKATRGNVPATFNLL